jgi:integrase
MEQVRNTIRRRHLSRRTEEAYAGWIRRFILFHGKRHPREMAEGEVAAFLTSLARGGSVSPSTQNQALAALLFLYKVVLERPLGWVEGVVHAKRPERLPVVLTRDEVRDLLGKLKGTPWLVATLLYGSGLRVLEALTLRIKDIDLEKQQFHVRDGKGRRDRRTMIPRAVMGPLREQMGVSDLPCNLTQAGKRSPNMREKWDRDWRQKIGGFQCNLACWRARNSTLATASSVGKWPLGLSTLRS